jgi:NADH-quinone oxidoreductase subunit C
MAEDKPTAKAGLSDEEKAKKIAAAKAAKAAKAKDDTPKQPWEEKPVAPSHDDAGSDADVTALADGIDGAVLSADTFAGDVTITVPADQIVDVCTFLKNERNFNFLVDLTAVDWPEREQSRFDVVYWLHRFDQETPLDQDQRSDRRLRLVAAVAEEDGKSSIASVSGIWRSANWMEREAYDMFGIHFTEHPNLERILTWEAFNGHPLRKDFPVEGIDTGAAIYNEVYPPGGGPSIEETTKGES